MPTDFLGSITNLINSPPGVLVAGGILAGIVWKFFERVESVLNDESKLEIAVSLVGVKLEQKIGPWPDTFANIFNRVFGKRFRSWRCFLSSSVASVCLSALIMGLNWMHEKDFSLIGSFVPNKPKPTPLVTHLNFITEHDVLFYLMPLILLYTLCGNVWFDYLSLGLSKLLLNFVVKNSLSGWRLFLCLISDASGSVLCGALAVRMALFLGSRIQATYPHRFVNLVGADYDFIGGFELGAFWTVWFGSAFFTSIWLWLYVGSGFILKAARRFDIGFQWFNRHFDIEKKPLQSIGLVAGALVAIVYWTAVIISRLI